ncbi:MAG: hypothetical protein ABEJ07_01885 [Candidatus Nanohaloarchaea archaeon]
MELSVQLILVATVAIITGTIVVFMVQGQSSDIGDFLGSQTDSAQCNLLKSQARSAAERGDVAQCQSKKAKASSNGCNVNIACS